MEKSQVSLPSDREVKVTRAFKAPKALVFKAYSDPALVRRWMLGPPGWTMPVCEMDLRVGGAYRWRWRSEDGQNEFGFHGVFREVVPGTKVVHTQSYDPGNTGQGEGGGEAIISVTFSEEKGVTTVTTLMDFGSKELRDQVIATGMTDGMEQSYQLLDKVLTEQR
jgi:uncharacterized protein YndB with AHSA1/START domain